MPEPILSRPKQPYRAPVLPMVLRGDTWKEALCDSALDRAGLFNRAGVRRFEAKVMSLGKLSEIDGMAFASI